MMMMMAADAVFLIFILLILAEPQHTLDDFKHCNRYMSFGYGYRDFFEFREKNFQPNQVFYLNFYVKTGSDAHILLKNDLVETIQGYEIVIGGGLNTFSQIRLIDGETKKTMMTLKTLNFLSETNYNEFWLSMDKLGILSVGSGDTVFLNWRFDNPFVITHFAFGSWTNMKADWRFGCSKGNESEAVDEERNLTPLQKLKADLFALYDPNSLPIGKIKVIEVKINFQVHNVELNEKRGELTVYGSGDMKWQDRKIKWKPEDYNGIDMIVVSPFQIWTPNLKVLNALSLDHSPLFSNGAAGVMVKSDGSAFWRPPFKSVSSCTVDLKSWPFGVHNCSVLIGFWMEPTNLVLTVMHEYDTMSKNKFGSEWEIIEVTPFNGDHIEEDNYGILYLELKRIHGLRDLLLTAPYVAAGIMSLSSFWVSPCGSIKLYLNCGSVIILLSALLLIGWTVPAMTSSVPVIVSFYSWSVVISCIPIILFVLLKNMPKSLHLSEMASKILNHSLLNFIFCFPELPQNLIEYSDLNEEVNKLNKDRLNAVRLLTVVERIFFVLYLIIILILAYINF